MKPMGQDRRGAYRVQIIAGRIVFGLAVLLLWEFSPELFGTSVFWFSRPSIIAGSGYDLLRNGNLLNDIGITVAETLAGLAAGCLVGIPIGIVLGRSRFLQELFEPFLLVINALPKIALAPLFLIWFGVGFSMKVAIAFSLVVVVMILSTYLGMRTLRQELINSCRTMGASELQLLMKVVLPSITPWLFAGLKVSLGFALIGAILGEFIAAQGGIGYLIDNAIGTFDTPVVFVGLFILLILSWLINSGIDHLRRLVSTETAPGETRIT
jgi:NitT/TauT family transport system permease protein